MRCLLRRLSMSGENPQQPKDSSIQINNIVFTYDEKKANAIDGISLDIKPGEHIAFVGPSGGGKTTLASLIARFWDVKQGSIKIGGVDVRDISSADLMKNVSYVFQDSKLLKMSILDNVRMGKHDALLAKGGIYDHMWKEYKKSVNWKMGREQNDDRKVTA